MTVFDRIKKLADDQQISIVELEERLGFGRNSLYSWKKKMPNSGNLEKVADYFDVTTDYLLGRETQNSPDWATKDDKIDLDKWLQSNVPMGFQGMDMDDETKIKVRAFLEGVFWEDKQKHRNDDNKK
ncbi:helix-turn-helix domain-containing protein [Lactiplantibacillus plantarum]|uniref:helix-turn-helix domain-containing protein n=1 Tax=Lactiplantibacillus plantarum TaxID=1590 RepID=UPI0024B8E956|nr:helix-turn-helix domain-containing protein [Lactiplantibacillus plantarum]